MTDGPLIVPVITPCGNVNFASTTQDATAQDVINVLLENEDVRKSILGELDDQGWDLQIVSEEPSGRLWEEDELERLNSGRHTMFLRLLKYLLKDREQEFYN